jgi:hypothetical protein
MPTNNDHLTAEDSMFAQLSSEQPETTAASSSVVAEVDSLKVAVSSADEQVNLSYDPVSVDDARQMRALNRSMRLGFTPPTASTR